MNARNLPSHSPSNGFLSLFRVVVRTMNPMDERRRWNLRHRAERADFERRAYFPRLDMGEQPDLRPGYHVEGDEGWMD